MSEVFHGTEINMYSDSNLFIYLFIFSILSKCSILLVQGATKPQQIVELQNVNSKHVAGEFSFAIFILCSSFEKTGSFVLSEESAETLYEAVKSQLWLNNLINP